MKTSVQSAGVRREKQRIKQRRLEEWTHYHDLPRNLKGLVRQSVQSEWQCTKGIDDEAILNSLPLDLRRDIRTHLYKERVSNVSFSISSSSLAFLNPNSFTVSLTVTLCPGSPYK